MFVERRPIGTVSAWRLYAVLFAIFGFGGLCVDLLVRLPSIDIRDDRGHLGFEINFLADSITTGNGFADPFGFDTGVSAWMPPTLPLALAILKIVLPTSCVVPLAYAIHIACMTVAFGLVAPKRGDTTRVIVYWFVVPITMLVWDYPLFRITHSHGLDMLILALIWRAFRQLRQPHKSMRHATAWGLAGGLLALTQPAFGVAWLVGIIRARPGLRFLVLANLVSLMVVLPWTLRNYGLFERFVPIKSNLAYEGWQSAVSDVDGIISQWSLTNHPGMSATNREARKMVAVGEAAYMDEKRQAWSEAWASDPLGQWSKVENRFIAAFLWYEPLFEVDLFNSVNLWSRRSWVIAATVAVLGALYFCADDRERTIDAVQLIACVLLPYVAVSFYERYAWPLIPLQVFLLVESIAGLVAFLSVKSR